MLRHGMIGPIGDLRVLELDGAPVLQFVELCSDRLDGRGDLMLHIGEAQ